MRTEPPPFMGALVVCPNGHREITTAQSFNYKYAFNRSLWCARCNLPLTLIKEAMIVPGRPLSEVDCRCVLA
jgi:hypothetical protein